LVVKTTNPQTLLDSIHELGVCFYCKEDGDEYRAVYFAANREVWFSGKLTQKQLEGLRTEAKQVKTIEVDELAGEIIITEES